MAPSVYVEIQKRAQALQAKDPRLSQVDAEAAALRDPELYKRYVEEASRPPERTTPTTRVSAGPTGAQAEVMQRAQALVRKSAELSLNDAVSRVFRDDPELYVEYAKGDAAPTFADELLGYELEGVYPLVNALMSTLRGIADASAGEKGAKIQAALSEFSAAVLRVAGQAGIVVPTEKRAQHPLAEDLLGLATALNPEDPTGKGMVRCRYALAELVKTVQRKRAVA
jgi:hypothetical protein